MKKNRIIYHGSEEIREHPQYGYGNPKNDYGLGFYCTQDLALAKEWSVHEDRNGYANRYELNMESLTCLNLSDTKYNILHWLTILLQNRVFTTKSDIAKAGKQYLIEHFHIPYEDYDVIEGYRADDSYFSFAEAFLNNTISCQRLSVALRLGHLGRQIVIKSKKAFKSLKYLDAEEADADIYYPLRKERNEKARLAFLSDKAGPYDKDALYLSDVIKEGVKEDDPRLR